MLKQAKFHNCYFQQLQNAGHASCK